MKIDRQTKMAFMDVIKSCTGTPSKQAPQKKKESRRIRSKHKH